MEGDKLKRAGKVTYAILFVFLMAFNFILMKAMVDDPFINFVVMAFLMNAVLGVAFRTIYHTITKDRNNGTTKKDS
jgi:drug/metabolite transporter (DMT)-like permease